MCDTQKRRSSEGMGDPWAWTERIFKYPQPSFYGDYELSGESRFRFISLGKRTRQVARRTTIIPLLILFIANPVVTLIFRRWSPSYLATSEYISAAFFFIVDTSLEIGGATDQNPK